MPIDSQLSFTLAQSRSEYWKTIKKYKVDGVNFYKNPYMGGRIKLLGPEEEEAITERYLPTNDSIINMYTYGKKDI
jgi:hypothetical protein